MAGIVTLQERRPSNPVPDEVPHQVHRRRLPTTDNTRYLAHRPVARRTAPPALGEPCANWLRYGIQPLNTGPGLVARRCGGRAHDRDHLGLGGRPVLASRHWSGETSASIAPTASPSSAKPPIATVTVGFDGRGKRVVRRGSGRRRLRRRTSRSRSAAIATTGSLLVEAATP